MTFAPSEDSDQPGHLPRLISLCCPHEETLGPQLPNEHTQTGQMPRLIRVFSGRTDHFVGFVMRLLKCHWNFKMGRHDCYQTALVFNILLYKLCVCYTCIIYWVLLYPIIQSHNQVFSVFLAFKGPLLQKLCFCTHYSFKIMHLFVRIWFYTLILSSKSLCGHLHRHNVMPLCTSFWPSSSGFY